jgi:hypothetical protein
MFTTAGSESKSDKGSLTATTLSVLKSSTVDLFDNPVASSELIGLDAPLVPGAPAVSAGNISISSPYNPALVLPPQISDTQSAPENPSHSKASKLLAAEEKTWREVNEIAGGSLQCYHEMTIEKMNSNQSGVIFPPEAAIPEGELIGDKKPGYENMTLKDKLLAWWTKKQWKIWSDQVLKEASVKCEVEPGILQTWPDTRSTRVLAQH